MVPKAYGTVAVCEVRQTMRNRQKINASFEAGKTRTKVGIPGKRTSEWERRKCRICVVL